MNLAVALMALSMLAIPGRTAGQTAQPDQAQPNQAQPDQTVPPDNPPGAPPAAPLSAPASQPASAIERPVSLKLLGPNLLSDQQHIWSLPTRLVKGHNWIPTAAILGVGAGLLALDPVEGAYFKRSQSLQGFNNVFTSNVTLAGVLAAPASLYALGLVRKDSKMQHTALLAGEAIADAEVVSTVLKDATKRVRPSAFPASGNFSDSWFEGGSALTGNGGFPSGHTIAAFSAATIVARRYGNHRWVPYAAYGLAALVGFSRLSLSAHFSSDVFIGGALGYVIGRFSVLRQ